MIKATIPPGHPWNRLPMIGAVCALLGAIACAILGAAIRFFHFALFDAELLSPLSYLADTFYAILVGCLAWRVTRAGQMARQYPWLYERTSPVTWRERAEAGEEARRDAEKIG